MNKRFFAAAFTLGLASVAWVGLGFAGSGGLALAMTALIGAVFLLGSWELHQYRADSTRLAAALQGTAPPAALGDWLAQVPAPLRDAVRLRVEGERAALPAPALTPYLVGLLVMLGMLGTFLGMVVTFKGAVFALEGSADLQAMRSALAAPIRGLGLAFGTSIAGVAASATLGLMSAIARRERLALAQRLDACIAGTLRSFSRVQQREESLRALQAQAAALPPVVEQLGALMERIERRTERLDEQLMARQARFQEEATAAYTGLARNVGESLKDSLAAGARAAGESISPVIASAVARIAQDAQQLHQRVGDAAQQLHQRVGDAAQQQAETLATAFEQRSAAALAALEQSVAASRSEHAAAEERRLREWSQTLAASGAELQSHWQRAGDATVAHQQALCLALERSAGTVTAGAAEQADRTLTAVAGLLERSESLVEARTANEKAWTRQQEQRFAQLADTWRDALAALQEQEASRGQAAVDRLGALEAAVARHLATLGTALEAPITRLLHTASEVPQAAAGVLAQLREETTAVAERDRLALQERTQLMRDMGELLQGLNRAAAEQRAGTEALLASASSVLEQAAGRFAQALDAQVGKAADMATQVGGSAVELASLGEAFTEGVRLFQASSEKLMDGLQRIETSLNRATTRSDEQLAYYVAQAREVIDLSIASQQGMVENLRQIRIRPALGEGNRA